MIRPLIGSPVLSAIIATLGLNIVLNSVAGLIWGHQTYTFPSPFAFSAPYDRRRRRFPSPASSASWRDWRLIGGYDLLPPFHLDRPRSARSQPEPDCGAHDGSVDLAHVGNRMGPGGLIGGIAGILVAPSLFLDTNLMGALLIKAFAGGYSVDSTV